MRCVPVVSQSLGLEYSLAVTQRCNLIPLQLRELLFWLRRVCEGFSARILVFSAVREARLWCKAGRYAQKIVVMALLRSTAQTSGLGLRSGASCIRAQFNPPDKGDFVLRTTFHEPVMFSSQPVQISLHGSMQAIDVPSAGSSCHDSACTSELWKLPVCALISDDRSAVRGEIWLIRGCSSPLTALRKRANNRSGYSFR